MRRYPGTPPATGSASRARALFALKYKRAVAERRLRAAGLRELALYGGLLQPARAFHGTPGAAGNQSVNVLASPGVLSTLIVPRCDLSVTRRRSSRPRHRIGQLSNVVDDSHALLERAKKDRLSPRSVV